MSSGREVLIVDDELAMASALAAALEARGHHVSVVATAEDALQMPEPEVLVADVRLRGGMGGLDLFDELISRGVAPRAILTTAMPTVADCRRALRLGASEFLTKPFSIDELVHAVECEASPSTPGGIAPARLQRIYAAGPRAAERAARDVGAWCLRSEVSPATRARIASTVCELVDNATRHAYGATREVSEHPIELYAEMDARALVLEVRDHGRGFDALGSQLDVMVCAKSGLARAAALSEDLTVRSSPDIGTRVRARFSVATADFDVEGSIDLTELDHLATDTARELLTTLADDPHAPISVSPALAVVIGRLLAGPDPRRALQRALWS